MNPSWLILHIVDALRVPSSPPHPADDYCTDALAFGLGVAAVVAFVAILAWAIIS
jgi:hypothetical protein